MLLLGGDLEGDDPNGYRGCPHIAFHTNVLSDGFEALLPGFVNCALQFKQ